MTMAIAPSTRAARILEWGMVVYLTIYAFEGPIRYLLLQLGLDDIILLRDAMLALLLVPLFFSREQGSLARASLAWFLAILGLHGLIIYANFHEASVIAYAMKEFLPILFGVVLGRLTGAPSRFVVYVFTALWGVTVLGLILDKFAFTFPWTGLSTVVGGIKVDIGRDWYTHGFDKRVGGFTRSSIHAAVFLPLLSMVLLAAVQRWLPRFLIIAVTCGCVLLTTQKGALVGYTLVSMCFLLRPEAIRGGLKAALVGGLLLTFALPSLLSGEFLHASGGVFSLSSFALRTAVSWPAAFNWISHNEVFPFGVGLGGIGGAQRLYAIGSFNAGDNMFLFLYASCGVMTFVYVGYLAFLCLSNGKRQLQYDLFPRAVVAFHFTYGAVMSVIEDQSSCMFLGLAIGYLLYARRGDSVLESGAGTARYDRRSARVPDRALADPRLPAA